MEAFDSALMAGGFGKREKQVEFDDMFKVAARQVDLAGTGGEDSFRLVPLLTDTSASPGAVQ